MREENAHMTYLALLEHSYTTERDTSENPPESRLVFLADQVFQFTTYDATMSTEFAQHAVDVCQAITQQTTFQYIEDRDRYRWFLLMCNMPFFNGRLDWGTSIRGAWWAHNPTRLESCGLWREAEQIGALEFTRDEWIEFIKALTAFAATGDANA